VVSATGGRRAGSLAYTGVPVAQILGLGVGLLVVGGLVMAAGYRPRRGLAD
jgi:5'-nucleotidase